MADLGINIALDPKTSHHLTRLAEVTKEPIQELAERLIREAIELEIEDFLASKISDKRDVEGAKLIRHEDVNWG